MHKEQRISDSVALKDSILRGIELTKAKDVVVLDLSEIENAVTNYFIICSGESTTQIEGIGDTIIRNSRKELQQKPWHQEGKGFSDWILLDYIDVVVHVFLEESRHFYNLEDLWADAKRTDIPNID